MYQLKTLVNATMKQEFAETAAKERLSEASLLRKIVSAAIKDDTQFTFVEPTTDLATQSITVYLPEFLKKAAAWRARTKYMTTSRWVSALIQSNLMSDPVMTHNQLAALNASIRELAAMGRNLNQIAKAANMQPGGVTFDVGLVKAIRSELIAHQEALRQLVKKSQRGWQADL